MAGPILLIARYRLSLRADIRHWHFHRSCIADHISDLRKLRARSGGELQACEFQLAFFAALAELIWSLLSWDLSLLRALWWLFGDQAAVTIGIR